MARYASILRMLTANLLFASAMGLAADKQKELQTYFENACDSKQFMGAVAMAVNGKVVFSDACGWAEAEWNVKNTVDTRFRTGSIAKQFTATAILLLHEQGKFELNDSIGKFLSDVPESLRSATIHH